jgi:hypothetical protein
MAALHCAAVKSAVTFETSIPKFPYRSEPMIPLPSPFRAVTKHPRRVVEALTTGSQVGSRRNAMIASTALTQRRAELTEVEDFFAGHGVTPDPPVTQRTGLPR